MRKNIGANFLEQKLFEYGLRAIEIVGRDQYKLISFSIFLGTEKNKTKKLLSLVLERKRTLIINFETKTEL